MRMRTKVIATVALTAAVASTGTGVAQAQRARTMMPQLNAYPVYRPHSLVWSDAGVYDISWTEWSPTLAVGLGVSWVRVITGIINFTVGDSYKAVYLPAVVVLTGNNQGLFNNLEVIVSGQHIGELAYSEGLENGDSSYTFPNAWPVQ